MLNPSNNTLAVRQGSQIMCFSKYSHQTVDLYIKILTVAFYHRLSLYNIPDINVKYSTTLLFLVPGIKLVHLYCVHIKEKEHFLLIINAPVVRLQLCLEKKSE